MKFRKPSEKVVITHTLADGDADKYVSAVIYDQNGTNVTPSGFINLTLLALGTYSNLAASPFYLPEGWYLIKIAVYRDTGYSLLDRKYGTVESDLLVSGFEQTILTEIPDNILLDNDARLVNLNTIPDLATTLQLDAKAIEIVNNINESTDNSDGRAV